jgi:secreted trypsin-like serine protease
MLEPQTGPKGGAVRRSLLIVLLAGAVLLLPTATANAITFGQPDGDLHPNVGALVADWDPDSPGPDVFCSGTLIARTVFLTAAHCIASLEAGGITDVWVTFASDYDEDAASPTGLFAGTPVAHPEFGTGGASDTHDIAVVLLDEAPAGITPAQLPTAGLLDQLKAGHQLRDQTFTAVGYGTVREEKTGGPHGFLESDGVRMYALQSALNLEKAWLLLSMNPSTGNGGTCYGDSGGPHFLGGVESNLIVSITITGDAMCRASDKTYRLDTAAARDFLDDFVTLP